MKGYPLRIVSSDAFADEKIRTMRAFGAEVELIPGPDGITPDLIPSMMRRAAEITAQTGAFAIDQFNNTDMVDGYRRLGEELLHQLPGPPPISAFCSYVGTAGCFLGVIRALAAALPQVHRVVVEPAESAVLSGRPPERCRRPHASERRGNLPSKLLFKTAGETASSRGRSPSPRTERHLTAHWRLGMITIAQKWVICACCGIEGDNRPNRSYSAIRRCRLVMTAQDGVTRRARHGCTAECTSLPFGAASRDRRFSALARR